MKRPIRGLFAGMLNPEHILQQKNKDSRDSSAEYFPPTVRTKKNELFECRHMTPRFGGFGKANEPVGLP